MKANFIFDTVIIIDHLNGVKKATDLLLKLKNDNVVISVITRAEILAGVNQKEKAEVNLLLDNYICLSIDKNIADKAAELRKKYKWKLPDAFQAALTLENNLILLTRNTKDFIEKEHKFIRIPYLIK